jgi:hypothetical protein
MKNYDPFNLAYDYITKQQQRMTLDKITYKL